MTQLLVVVALGTLVASAGQAAFLFDWTTTHPHQIMMPDPLGDGGNGPGSDITKVWWAADESYQYFRLDLDVQPSLVNGGAEMFGVFVDAQPAVSGGATSWIPTDLIANGVDYALVIDYANDFVTPQVLSWNNGSSTWQSVTPISFNRQVDGTDYILEWRVAASTLPSYYTPTRLWGATLILGPQTLDQTSEVITPEPASLALLSLGLGGLYLKRRRKS